MKKHILFRFISILLIAFLLSACTGTQSFDKATSESPMESYPYSAYPQDNNMEEYAALEENLFRSVMQNPLSTFSADVDTAAYCNLRRMIRQDYGVNMIPSDAVRVEEMLNYFTYDYAQPEDGEVFGVTAVIGDCPWNSQTKLMVMGLRTAAGDYEEAPAANLVFLIDVSGSMQSEDKLDLLKKAFSYLTKQLRPKDTISIVTYAGREAVVLDGASGNEPELILESIDRLESGGSTNGSAGLSRAYELAKKHFIPNGVNRIVLASDGDLNVGIVTPEELEQLVTEQRESGVYLSVLGFGSGNYKDNKMEAIAQNGNGNYHYIDCVEEAERIFGRDLCATMVPVADDVKFQVEFNPEKIKGYRLIGYENRLLNDEDFIDDKKDAGEVGTGHCVTVAYELILADSEMEIPTLESNTQTGIPAETIFADEWLYMSARYKEPGQDESVLRVYPVCDGNYSDAPGEDWRFAACIIQLGMVLRGSEYTTMPLSDVLEQLNSLNLSEPGRVELRELVAQLCDR